MGFFVKRAKNRMMVDGVKSKFLTIELDSAAKIADAGFFISVAHSFTGPTTSFIGYKDEWVDEYTDKSYVLSDPALHWTSVNTGITRWSEIDLPDPGKILDKAKVHGINYGAAAAVIVNSQRTIATFGREASEFSDVELHLLEAIVEKVHLACLPEKELTDLEVKTLKILSDGHTMVEVAKIMGVSNQLIISRMQNIRSKFSAQSNMEALAVAMRMKIIT